MSAWSTEDDPGPGRLRHPLAGLANALRLLFLLCAVLAVVLAFLAVRMRIALDASDPDALIPGADASSETNAFLSGSGIFFLTLGGIGVLFVIWFWRAARNNESFGRPGALGPGWTIGAWFIPLGSFVIPAIQLQQIWRGADGAVPRGDPGWREVPGSVQLWIWWVSYMLAMGLTYAGFVLITQTEQATDTIDAADLLDHLPDVRLGVTLFVAGQALMVLAAGLGAAMVVALSRRQETGAAAIGPPLPGAAPTGWSRPVSPPAWHPDPTGRFDQRYWDGRLWTDHVMRGQEQTTDPVDPDP